MPDEYFYSKYSRLIPFSEAEIPGYLYYFIYSITALWGDSYLELARILNVFFYVIGCLFVYLVSILVIPRIWALFLIAIVLFMPTSFFVAYFMPEPIYFCFFWIMQYTIMSDFRSNIKKYIISGIVYGSLILIKPHAWFLLPILIIFFLVKSGLNKSNVRDIIIFVITFLLIRVLIGLLIGGIDSLTMFGVAYTEHADTAVNGLDIILLATKDFILVLIAHVFAISLLFGVAIAESMSLMKDAINDKVRDFIRMLWLHLLIMVPIVSLFAVTASLFENEWTYRIHMRYYIFIFPYFLMILIYGILNQNSIHNNISFVRLLASAILIIAPIGMIYYYYLNFYFYPFAVGIADIPEIFLITHSKTLFYLVGFLSILSMVLWLLKPGLGRIIYLAAFLPIYLATVWYNHGPVNTARFVQNDVDIVGRYLVNHVITTTQDSTLVVGYRESSLYAIMMYSNSRNIRHMKLSTLDPLRVDSLSSDIRYVMSLDSINLHSQADLIWSQNGSVFYRIRD